MSKSNNHLSKQSGRKNLPFAELRTHSVNVRLNESELALLDKVRSRYQRAEAMRMLALTKLPTPILVPEINREMAVNIGRSFGNLATLATAMRAGEYVEISKIKAALSELQIQLISKD